MMPQYIMKIHDDKFDKDYYLMWSTVVDAPVTEGMSLNDFKSYYHKKYGDDGMEKLIQRLERVEATGISAMPPFDDLNSYFGFNRAGKNEKTLNKEGILKHYCRNADT